MALTSMLLVGAVASTAVAGEEQQELARQLEQISTTMEKAALAGDYDTILAYHTDDAIVCADMHPPIEGKAALRAGYAQQQKEGVKIHAISATISSIWTCGERVYTRGTFGMTSSSRAHPDPVGIHGSYFQIWRHEAAGTYRIEYTIWNLGFNPFEGSK
jgi:ketosteroid isomerase-like protein